MAMGEHCAVSLHHETDGDPDAPPLLLLGSLGSALDMWEPQLPALTPGHRVIRVDHRGHGKSPVPPGPYAVAELAGDVLALLDRLELDRVDLLGLSLGGAVGMYLASEAPERIGRLALCATSAHWPDQAVWQARIDAVSEGGTEAVAEAVARTWFTPEFARAHPDRLGWAAASIRATAVSGYLACCQALRDWDHVGRLGAITAPTLLICGTADPATPEDPHGATIAAGIPDVRLERTDAAHLLTIERADEVNALLTAHLGG
jgi:3-oxoadipate enol-lactonase